MLIPLAAMQIIAAMLPLQAALRRGAASPRHLSAAASVARSLPGEAEDSPADMEAAVSLLHAEAVVSQVDTEAAEGDRQSWGVPASRSV